MIQSKIVQEKTERFFKIVQAGDITLFNILEEVVAVFGFTKVGKTSSCHMMCGSPLKGQNVRGELVFKSTGTRFTGAKIGANTESQTQIPNIFQGVVKQPGSIKPKKIIVLDQPGYGDTYGFHRVYSNGYFIYRTLSKTPKLKFVLAFRKDDLSGTGEYFKKTIKNFINTFNYWDSQKQSILKAVSFLITKADVNTKLQNLKSMIKNLRESSGNLSSKQFQNYQLIIDAVMDSDRIFFIQRPKDAYSSRVEDKILQQIYQKSTFWQRPVLNNKNVVDMSPINFSVAKQITAKLRDIDSQCFRQQFDYFMAHISNRIRNIILEDKASLSNIINTLKNDAKGSSESSQFLQDMKQFNSKYYQFFDQYKSRREETEVSLFKSQEPGKWKYNSNQDLMKEMKSAYFIKKFKVLEYFQQVGRELDLAGADRTIEELQQFSNLFIAMFRKFSILRVSANDNDKTIYKYSYIIQRIIEQSKVLTLILFSNESIKQEIENLKVQLPTDLYFIIRDQIITLVLGEINLDSLKEEFIGKLDFDNLKIVKPQTIQFFEGIVNKQEEIELKIAHLIIQFALSLLKNDKTPPQEGIIFAGQKLYNYRNKFYAHLRNLENNGFSQSSKESITEIIVQLTNVLAKVLLHLHFFSQARECYQSVSNAESVFQIFEKQAIAEAASTKGLRNLFVEYSKMATYFSRRDLALKCCQKVYSLSSSFDQMKQASAMIIDLMTQKKDQKDDEYLQKLMMQDFCQNLSQDLRDKIEIALNL